MEIFDLVNKKDEVMGKTSKKEAHLNGHPHRVAAIFVFTNDGKLFVQHRRKDDLLDHSAAGHVKTGETYDTAAKRELFEELHIAGELTKLGVFYADERVPTRKLQVVHFFGLYEIYPPDPVIQKMTLARDEVKTMMRMAIPDIADLMRKEPSRFTTGFICTLNYYIGAKELSIPLIPVR